MNSEAIQRACDGDLYANREGFNLLGAFAREKYTVQDAIECELWNNRGTHPVEANDEYEEDNLEKKVIAGVDFTESLSALSRL